MYPSKVTLDTKVLDGMVRELGTNVDKALMATAFQVEAEARNFIRMKHIIDTGALMNSIHTEKKSPGLYWVSDGVEYGIYHEWGTYKMSARTFMLPATIVTARFMIERWGNALS